MTQTLATQPNRTRRGIPNADKNATYASMDVLSLMERITGSDALAMRELLLRKLLRINGRQVDLLEWADHAKQQRPAGWRAGDSIPEDTYDLCIDRFTSLPSSQASGPASCDSPSTNDKATVKTGGTDCRYYYRGFLKHVRKVLNDALPMTALERNALVLRLFQGYVLRHWRLCWLDAWRRQQKMTVPYECQCEDSGGSPLRCRVPRHVPAGTRDAWLERTVGPIDPRREGEAQRVQAMIDAWLKHDLREQEVRLRTSVDHDVLDSAGLPFSLEHEWSQGGLAAAVAKEKAATPHRQRRSIAALGPDRIRDLVQTIFNDMIADRYHPSEVAKQFGLHKSTLTRFAAANWQPGQPGPEPDLWVNTAQVLVSQTCFAAAIKEAGLQEVIANLSDRLNHTPKKTLGTSIK